MRTRKYRGNGAYLCVQEGENGEEEAGGDPPHHSVYLLHDAIPWLLSYACDEFHFQNIVPQSRICRMTRKLQIVPPQSRICYWICHSRGFARICYCRSRGFAMGF